MATQNTYRMHVQRGRVDRKLRCYPISFEKGLSLRSNIEMEMLREALWQAVLFIALYRIILIGVEQFFFQTLLHTLYTTLFWSLLGIFGASVIFGWRWRYTARLQQRLSEHGESIRDNFQATIKENTNDYQKLRELSLIADPKTCKDARLMCLLRMQKYFNYAWDFETEELMGATDQKKLDQYLRLVKQYRPECINEKAISTDEELDSLFADLERYLKR